MGIFGDAFAWLTTAANWTGGDGILVRIWQHVLLSAVPVAAAVAVAVPAGAVLGHWRRGALIGGAIANVGRAVPTLALLVLGLLLSLRLGLGLGYWPSVLAFFALALHPIFTNAYTAVREVEPSTVEAARGMGMTEREILTGVELPVSVPVILAAVRVTAVQVVATAPLAALIAGGGLGRPIVDGFQSQQYGQMLGGIVLIAAAAVATEVGFDLAEKVVVPTGLQRADRAEVAATGRAV